jgi:hypothetical protein
MRGWDLFLCGTAGAEGIGAAQAAAMDLGLPCVVADIGPMRKSDGDDGAVRHASADCPADFSRASAALLGDYWERSRISARAQRFAAESLDGARLARKIAELFGLGNGFRSWRPASIAAA